MTKEKRPVGPVRRAVGDILLAAVIVFTVLLAAVMVRRIHTVVLADIYRKAFRNELIMCLALLLGALDVRFSLFSWPGAVLRVLGWLVRLPVIAACAVILFLMGRVVFTGMTSGAGTSDHVIVLGMALENGQPTQDLLYRVETARRYGEKHPESTLILTGGNPDAQGRTEAAVMRDILVADGFPEERLLLEDKASNTFQNFRNTAQLIDPDEPVMLVSSNYHMKRAVKNAEQAGFSHVIRLPAPSSPLPYASNLMWEVVMELNGYLHAR